ncbi:fibronectin type III and SPRY domain-containing protein 2 isoform 2-T2 [Discoglossus pictus]
MEPDSSEEFVMSKSPEEFITILDDAAQKELEEQVHASDPKGLTFYHTDLYGSRRSLEIFPEESLIHGMSGGVSEQEAEKEKWDFSPEKIQSDLQKEVDDLAKHYGLSEDKDVEEIPCLTPLSLKHMEHISSKNTSAYNKKVISNQNKEREPADKVCQNTVKQVGLVDSLHGVKESGHPEHESQQHKHEAKQIIHEEKQSRNEEVHPENKNHRQEVKQIGNSGETHETQEPHDEISKESDVPDIYCISCKTPIRAFEKLFGEHKDHDVKEIVSATDDIKKDIRKNISQLEEQIAQMETFASHLEEIFVTVEENFARREQNFEMHYTEVMDAIATKHEEKVNALAQEKTLKLESLYEQLINCGKSLDTSKDLMETIQQLFKGTDKVEFVKSALQTTNRLHDYFNLDINLNISTSAEYKNNNIDFSEVEQLLESINTVPAPSAPVINPQTPNSATATSLRVCWSLFSDDTVESYQLFYRPVCDETPGEDQEEFMIPAKETYCTVNNLIPNAQYEFWVTALNTTGESPASECSVYVTAPSPPIIKSQECRSCENAALICWESGNSNPVDSYTVELYKVTNEPCEDCVTESIVGIPICETLIQLQPRETYHITVRAVNVGGPSESSRPVSIHTTGTFFHLNEETAHPLLSISDNGFTIICDEEESLVDLPYHCKNFTRCIAIMGNLIPFKGKHYWEVEVDEDTEYRIGVAYEDTNRNTFIGTNNTSWCLRHILTPSRHKYEFLHCGISPDIRITIPPTRIGILLDYDHEKLSFFNMNLVQHLFTFECHFRHFVHPCFALDKPGSLKIHNGIPIPFSVI